MNQQQAHEFIANLGEHTIDTESHENLILFKTPADQIFAIIHTDSDPLRIEAKCDRQLAKLLRERYESVLASNNMDKKSWNEIICAGQLSDEEIQDLLRLSYNLVTSPDSQSS
ncbi:MmcQ/YjbR family DNA-binding protein [Candidatus Saccharibacteria bacterium]|nr:MmcQ/YjbR family DNA-binding protein [Candidatus Saccharibacteria bacterium]